MNSHLRQQTEINYTKTNRFDEPLSPLGGDDRCMGDVTLFARTGCRFMHGVSFRDQAANNDVLGCTS